MFKNSLKNRLLFSFIAVALLPLLLTFAISALFTETNDYKRFITCSKPNFAEVEAFFMRQNNKNTKILFGVSIISILITVLFVLLIVRRYSTMFNDINTSIHAVKENNFTRFINYQTHVDELEMLVANINQMIYHLQKRDESIHKLSTMKDHFVATMAHDLKTPLSAQIQTLKLMQKGSFGSLNHTQQDVVERMILNNTELLEMVYTLVDTYKYDAGMFKLYVEEMDFAELLHEVMEEVESLSQAGSITLIYKGSKQSIVLKADRTALKRVLRNIITNAIEHSPQKSQVVIALDTYADHFDCKIKDHGIGIPEDLQPDVFKSFTTSRKKFGKIGTGLGLPLSKQIVEQHGGTLSFISAQGLGTEFIISLPMCHFVLKKDG